MFYISLWISKLYYRFIEKNKKSDKVGLLALKLDKNFLNKINKPKIVIAVTGTNGKTTTCNLLNDILTNLGYIVASNSEGANLKPGISKAFMKNVNIFNKTKADIAIIEFDELSSSILLPSLKPNYVVVTNLFLDTMHRNGHTDYVFNKINEGIPSYSKLILNADDLISSMLGNNNEKIYFSINKQKNEISKESLVKDIRVCPKCYTNLEFNFNRYNHLGFAKCPKCNFKNPKPDYKLTNIDYKNKKITINKEDYILLNDSIFNIYNELTIITILKELGIKNINKELKKVNIVKSRLNKEKIKDVTIIRQMLKGLNAIACSRVFDTLNDIKEDMEIILLLDDIYDKTAPDRREVTSYIYDTDFEKLNKKNIKKNILGGINSYDYKVRLLLSGIEDDKIIIEENEIDTYKHLDYKYKNVIIIHDIYQNKNADTIISKIKEVL